MRGSAGPPPCPSRQSAHTTDTLGHDPAHKETEIDYSRPEWIWLSRLFKSCQACQCRSQSRPESMLSETSAASSVMCSHHIQHTFSPSVLPGFTEKKKIKGHLYFRNSICIFVHRSTGAFVLLTLRNCWKAKTVISSAKESLWHNSMFWNDWKKSIKGQRQG